MATLEVDIVSAEGEIYSGEAAMVFAPASMGEIGIAPRHAPLMTTLKPGEVRVQDTNGTEHFFYVTGGILEVQPHVVMVLADTAMRLGIRNGQTAELGRKPNPPGLAFPSREGQENIRWCSGERAAQARSSQFTLDRVLAGRRQAAVHVTGGEIQLESLHDSCPTYILRNDKLHRVAEMVKLEVGDLIVVGTTVVRVRVPD